MTRGKSLSFAWPESFVQRYWIDGTKIGNFFDYTTIELLYSVQLLWHRWRICLG